MLQGTSKGHARGERGWEGRDTNHSGYGRERPQQGHRQWDADLNGRNGYKDTNGFGGGSRYQDSDDGHPMHARDHRPTFSPRPPNSSGLVRKRKFVPPGRLDGSTPAGGGSAAAKFPGGGGGSKGGGGASNKAAGGEGDDELPEELQHLEKAMVEKIMQEVQQRGDPVTFDQIAGLEFAKKSVIEVVCWPMERPDIFVGLRALPKGLLLFGPPGTGECQMRGRKRGSRKRFPSQAYTVVHYKRCAWGGNGVRTPFHHVLMLKPPALVMKSVIWYYGVLNRWSL